MAQKLLDQVTEVARLKHLSIRTEKQYRYYIKQFILFHRKRHLSVPPRRRSESCGLHQKCRLGRLAVPLPQRSQARTAAHRRY
jgi:integrase-like protein